MSDMGIETNKPQVRVYANNDQAMIAWKYETGIDNCVGYAIFRKYAGESDSLAIPLLNRVGFEGEIYDKGEQRPTTEWPIQRFNWTDNSVKNGDVVCYKVYPVIWDPATDELSKDEQNASAWTSEVRIRTNSAYEAYFNRGVLSSLFFDQIRTTFAEHLGHSSVSATVEGGQNELRDLLGGHLAIKLLELLDEISENDDVEVYGVLSDLRQSDLVNKLCAIGKRAHIVLAGDTAHNADVIKALENAGVDVHPRHVGEGILLIITEKGKNEHVWIGSSNCTAAGLFSQVNNGLMARNNSTLATTFMDRWLSLRTGEKTEMTGTGQDVAEALSVLDDASSVLFLLFDPGMDSQLYRKILEIHSGKQDVYVQGVINRCPGEAPEIVFFRNGRRDEGSWSNILPEKLSREMGFADQETAARMAAIHSNVVVTDPFSDKCTLMIDGVAGGDGVVILKDKKLVEEYTVNILSLFDDYRLRFSLSDANPTFGGTKKEVIWMKRYMGTPKGAELDRFWFRKTRS